MKNVMYYVVYIIKIIIIFLIGIWGGEYVNDLVFIFIDSICWNLELIK